MSDEMLLRFWTKVDKNGPLHPELGTRCWLWTGCLTPEGYGWFSLNSHHVQAHRFAYEQIIGALPGDSDHRCHNRACVNPQHLRPATRKQNLENLRGAFRTNYSSGVRGVTWDAFAGRWKAQLTHHYRNIHVGRFDTIAEAEAAVIAKRLELFTHNDRDRQ